MTDLKSKWVGNHHESDIRIFLLLISVGIAAIAVRIYKNVKQEKKE